MHEPVEINPMSNQWLLDHSREVGERPVLLVQGHPATGFAVASEGKIDFRLEPDVHEAVSDLPWRHYFDVRMFGSHGEWHCWRIHEERWRGRLATRADDEWQETGKAFSREYALWGTKFDAHGNWIRCSEKRGAIVWVPAEYCQAKHDPFRLQVCQRVEFDPETGIAGVADAMILGFVGGSQ